jgi:2-dehydropantoate 2-reductase
MRLAVLGAGGVGGYFGARLAAAGTEVSFVARGAHAAAMRSGGLRIESPKGDLHLPKVAVVERVQDLPDSDVVLNCVKLWDLEESGRLLAAGATRGALVVPIQNGVESSEILRRHLPAERVAAGIAYISAEIAAPGLIRHVGPFARLNFGALLPAQRPVLEALVEACHRAKVEAGVSDDIRRDLWGKFIMLQALAGATASRRTTVGALRDSEEGRALLLGLVREAVALGRAEGVALPDDAETTAWATLARMPPAMRASMALDLERGNRLELPWLNGYVARRSAERGLDAPLSNGVVAELGRHAEGARR